MKKYCGYIGIIGRPNVGKSTLLNRLLGQKISITSRKPQTTRHRVLGIQTLDTHQLVYVDTPGMQSTHQNAMHRLMNKAADYVIQDVDILMVILDASRQTKEDQAVLQKLAMLKKPVILALNKVDTLADKGKLLPLIESLRQQHDFAEIIPLSAKTGDNVVRLEQCLCSLLPEGPHLFSKDMVTDRPTSFVIAEFVREKIFRQSGEELPYAVTVEIEKIEMTPTLCRVAALIWVEKESHKRMIIGKQGSKLKTIGEAARADIETLVSRKVFLQLWVKVKQGWSDDERALKQLGYDL